MVNNTVRGVPVWFNEGLAEYYRRWRWPAAASRYSSAAFTRRTCCCCASSSSRLTSSSPSITARRSTTKRAKASIFYAESWALVHYLLLGEKQKYAPKAGLLLDALVNGTAVCGGVPARLGISVAQLQKELRSYVERESFTMHPVDVSRAAGGGRAPAGAPVQRRRRTRHRRRAAAADGPTRTKPSRHLEFALTLEPGNAQAHSTLGMLLRAGRTAWTWRVTHLQQAAGGAGATAQTHYRLADDTAANSRGRRRFWRRCRRADRGGAAAGHRPRPGVCRGVCRAGTRCCGQRPGERQRGVRAAAEGHRPGARSRRLHVQSGLSTSPTASSTPMPGSC